MDQYRAMAIRCLRSILHGSAFDSARPSHDGAPHPGYRIPPGPWRNAVLAFSSGLGTGYSPWISGTTGTLAGVALFWLLAPPRMGWTAYAFALALLIVLAVLAANAAEGIYRKKDDGRIVIDEVVGYLLTMMWAPRTARVMILGFLLFRFFDVVKLAPAFRIQMLRGGKGVVFDDLVAGLYACLSLHLLILLKRFVC